jgi:predicted MFS family arabinose efflux permease
VRTSLLKSTPWIITFAFVALGAFWGSWNAALASVQQAFGLSNTSLGVLLAIGVTAGAAAGAATGHLGRKQRPLHVLCAILALWGVLLIPLISFTSFFGFALSFSAVQIVMGAVDAQMNVGATAALFKEPGALVRFHGFFNVGCIAGAFGTAAFGVTQSGGARLLPFLAGILLFSTAWWWLRSRRADDQILPDNIHVTLASPTGDASVTETAHDNAGIVAILRRDRMLTFLVVFAAAALVEGGVFTWGVLYLRRELHIGLFVGASAYALGNVIAFVGRFFGGPLIASVVPMRALSIGSAFTAVGLIIEALTHVDLLAVSVFVIAAAGVSLNWPLLMADVGRRSSSPGSAVGAFTAAGYLGWVAGAPFIGIIADQWSLAGGLICLGLLSFLVGAAAVVLGKLEPKKVRSR